jgi:MFS transporter, OFA family, oxalate/formate antiporter
MGFWRGIVSMRGQERLPNRWLIAVMCTVLQLCLGTVYAWSYFQPLLVEQFRWTNTATSWAFSLNIFCLGLSAAWGGINLARIGPRNLAMAGGLLFAAGYAMAAVALALKSLILLYLGYGVVAGVGTGLGYVTPMSTVIKWFPDKKGLLTGIVAMGFGLGAFVLTVVLAPILMRAFHGNLTSVFAALGAILGSAAFGSATMLRDPPAGYLPSGYVPGASKDARAADLYSKLEEQSDLPIREYLLAGQYAIMWFIFFLNITAGISIVSFLSPLYQDIWRLDHPTLERSVLAGYGATLIAVSSLFNGFGRIAWGGVSDWLGRLNTFRLLLASQLIVFGMLMTERNPWVFAILVCYVLSCFGGGFAIMPSMVIDVYGPKRMSRVYGIILTAWSAAGILGPLIVAKLKDNFPDRAIVYSFLLGILVLGIGFIFSFLAYDDRFIPRRILLQVFALAPPRHTLTANSRPAGVDSGQMEA